MKKILLGLFIFGFLMVGSQASASSISLSDLIKSRIQNLNNEIIKLTASLKASALDPLISVTSTTDLTPRISYYSGKVNQHVDIASGTWQTDTDGSSGSSIDKLTYCKKWYPNTTSVVDYKTETISSWHDGGNVNNYTSTRMSYKCVEATTSGYGTTTSSYTSSTSTTSGYGTTTTSTPTFVSVYTSAGSNGAISPTGPISIPANLGQTQTFVITPNSGYTASVTGCGGSLSGSIYTTSAITGACTVSASFSTSYVPPVCTNGATNYPTCTVTNSIPVVTYPIAYSVERNSASLGMTVTSLGYPANSSYGYIYYGTTPRPTASVKNTTSAVSTGNYNISVSGLNCGTKYYFYGALTNATGSGYSADGTFTTLSCDTIVTPVPISPTTDLTPRISVWQGKVNQHVDVASKMWQTDSDGVSGADIDKLTYCKKFYPNTTSVAEYKTETINTWHDRYNLNNYSSTRMSYKCVESVSIPSSVTVLSPKAGDVFTAGQTIQITWTPGTSGLTYVNFYKSDLTYSTPARSQINPNTSGSMTYTFPNNMPSGQYKIYAFYENNINGSISSVKLFESDGYFTISPISIPTIAKVSPCSPYGDVDYDGYVSEKDTNLMMQNIGGSSYFTYDQTKRGDMNKDGYVTSLDITYIKGYLAGTKNEFPVCAPTEIKTVTTDLTPRISVWQGKVNQHVDVATKTWKSDSDGTSGAEIDKLTYCKKFYPATTSVVDYKTETINSWHDRYNLNNYSSTRMTYKCVESVSIPTSNVDLKVNGSDFPSPVLVGSRLNVTWAVQGVVSCKPTGQNVGGWNYLTTPISGTTPAILAVNNDLQESYYSDVYKKDGYQISLTCEDSTGFIVRDSVIIPITRDSSNITVLSPNGGETYDYSQNMTVTWSLNNISGTGVYIYLIDQNGKSFYVSGFTKATNGSIVANTTPNTGSYTWNVSKKVDPEAAEIVPVGSINNRVKIRICDYKGVCDESNNYITITANGNINTPSITVLSPNGGETYTAGQQITVKWGSQNVSTNALINISIENPSDNSSVQLTPNYTINDGLELVTLPTSVTWPSIKYGNNFKINAHVVSIGNNVLDFSDNTFTILPPSTPKIAKISPCSPYGDVDYDGYVSEKDTTLMKQNIGGVSYFIYDQTKRGDVNKDGYVSGMDITLINNYLSGVSNSLPVCTSTPVIGGQKILNIYGNQSNYLANSQIELTINSIDNTGNPASSSKGFNVQSYIYPSNDISFGGRYLTPNPATSYNGTYDTYSGTWKVKMNTPSSIGSYNLRVALYCSNPTICSNSTEDIKVLPFTISNTVAPITPTSDLTPRISVWQGKVNQHVSVSEKMWQTDSDGVSGAELDKLTYCKKFYPAATSVVEYKTETINAWHDRGNVNDYPSTRMTYKCVESVSNISGKITQSLDVTSHRNMTVSTGSNDVEVVTISLKNTGTTDVLLNGVHLASSSNLNKYINHIKVFDSSTNKQFGQTINNFDYNGEYYYAWVKMPSSLSIPTGTKKIFRVIADIPNGASQGSFAVGTWGLNFDAPGAMMSPQKINGNTITINPSTVNPNNPTISGVSGPQSLALNQMGTWKITASSSNSSGSLSYMVDWGEATTTSSTKSAIMPQQTATLTHSYSQPGIYTPTFTVISENTIRCITTPCPSNEGSATTSLSVNVGGVSNVYVANPGAASSSSYGTSSVYVANPGAASSSSYSTSSSYATSGGTYIPINRTLKRGVRGDDVKRLQEFLGIIPADGKFGPGTEAKVKEWQLQNGLKVDGSFGPEGLRKSGL